MDIKAIREKAVLLKQNISLSTLPVGVKFLFAGHRYCQALMKARRGERGHYM